MSLSSDVYKNNDSVEASNNILTTENRKVDKTNKISERKNRKKTKKTLILGESIVKDIEEWILNRRFKSSISVKAVLGATTKGVA